MGQRHGRLFRPTMPLCQGVMPLSSPEKGEEMGSRGQEVPQRCQACSVRLLLLPVAWAQGRGPELPGRTAWIWGVGEMEKPQGAMTLDSRRTWQTGVREILRPLSHL